VLACGILHMLKNFSYCIAVLILMNSAWAESKFNCSNIDKYTYSDEYKTCINLDLTEKASAAGVDCPTCFEHAQEEKEPSTWLQVLSAVAQPASYFLSNLVTAKYQYKSQQALADAYSSGYKECTSRFNSYLNYSTSSGANPIGTTDAATLMGSCNGSSTSAYAGYAGYGSNGYGGYSNNWLGSGYSSGFMTGMVGPNFGTGYSSGYGLGLGSNTYSGLNSGLYGSAGLGLYGNIGASSNPYLLNYSSAYPNYGSTGVYAAGVGINSLYSGAYSGYNSSAYLAGNLTASIGIGGSAGFSF